MKNMSQFIKPAGISQPSNFNIASSFIEAKPVLLCPTALYWFYWHFRFHKLFHTGLCREGVLKRSKATRELNRPNGKKQNACLTKTAMKIGKHGKLFF